MEKFNVLNVVITCVLFVVSIRVTAGVLFTEEPVDTMIDQRARVRLFCSVSGLLRNQEVVWHKDNLTISIGLGMFVDHHTVDLKRYRIIGNRDKGYFDLKIIDIVRIDEGEYRCVVYNRTRNPLQVIGAMEAQSRVATVTVYYTPMKKYPYCPFGDASRELKAGESISACISEIGRPNVMLELQGPYARLPATNTDYTSVPGFAVLTMNVTTYDHGRTYTCRARSPDFPFYTSTCSVGPLHVVYPPRVAIRPLKVVLSPGEEGVFICEIEAQPSPTRIKWTFIPPFVDRSRYRLLNNNQTLKIFSVSASDDSRLMVCTVGNAEGNTSSERVLALSKGHRPLDSHHASHHHHHFGILAGCSQANVVIIACAVALGVVMIALVCVVCCRMRLCSCRKTPRKSSRTYQKHQRRDEHLDAHAHVISHDDTHRMISRT